MEKYGSIKIIEDTIESKCLFQSKIKYRTIINNCLLIIVEPKSKSKSTSYKKSKGISCGKDCTDGSNRCRDCYKKWGKYFG